MPQRKRDFSAFSKNRQRRWKLWKTVTQRPREMWRRSRKLWSSTRCVWWKILPCWIKCMSRTLHTLKNFPCTFLRVKRSLGKSEKASSTNCIRRQRQADFRKMHRLPMIWKANVTALRKSFMIWSLPEPFLCRLHRRSAWSRTMIRRWSRRSRQPL